MAKSKFPKGVVSIWQLQPGQIAVTSSGLEYELVKDEMTTRPLLGRVKVRICRDIETGELVKFIYGIPVTIREKGEHHAP